ncbi:NAD(P)-binding protein [Rhizodiscina lignyota]|uniref:NAD(P)-binding protein n=1 Tax=Rhizodiscina lignyota TaxID=1504668 RepID=A0A9P4I5U2_9PEZI|nr:NAD(P)-binding protein [Rhizodiscina lignyota]
MPSVLQLFSLEGQTAVITGATRGIGQAIALALAEAGADILLVQRDTSKTETKEAVEKLGRKCSIYTADLSSHSSVSALIPKILADKYDIHILVNCAGIQRRHPVHKFPDDDWNEVLQVNLSTVFTLCRDVGAHMLSREPDSRGRRGSIINFASLMSFQGGLNIPAYAASKGGVSQMTKTMSNDWASKGITINCIAPGYIATEMNTALINDEARAASILARIPAGRWGTPEDFKGAVLFLASRASSYVSGEILTVDGGWMGR